VVDQEGAGQHNSPSKEEQDTQSPNSGGILHSPDRAQQGLPKTNRQEKRESCEEHILRSAAAGMILVQRLLKDWRAMMLCCKAKMDNKPASIKSLSDNGRLTSLVAASIVKTNQMAYRNVAKKTT
jgi:hypothetical protein